jgi:hypothetical protein
MKVMQRFAAFLSGLGVALIVTAHSATADPKPIVHKVGAVTWHAKNFVDHYVTIVGYVLAKENDYVLLSDEAGGKISPHDLPVTGAGSDEMQPHRKYVVAGRFMDHGLTASNGSRYHLELNGAPGDAKP